MSDLVPIPTIAGLLTPFVTVDLPVAHFTTQVTLTEFYPTVLSAPSGGTVAVDLRTATGGGGSGISATIGDGLKAPATPATGSIVVAAGTTLYLRITAESGGATDLSGVFLVQPLGPSSGATTFLTTLQKVKDHAGITTATHDALLTDLIACVSGAMQERMRRQIIATAVSGEKHDGGWPTINVREWPIESAGSVTVSVGGVALSASDWELHENARQIMLASGASFTSGIRNVEISYTGGFATVPADLTLAATKQVRHEFNQTQSSGQNRIGLRSVSDASGAVTTFELDAFLSSVEATMALYARVL